MKKSIDLIALHPTTPPARNRDIPSAVATATSAHPAGYGAADTLEGLNHRAVEISSSRNVARGLQASPAEMSAPSASTPLLQSYPDDLESISAPRIDVLTREQTRARGKRVGAIIGAVAATMVGAQMVYRSAQARPDSAVLAGLLFATGFLASGSYGIERLVYALSVYPRDALASVAPVSLWVTRYPDKRSDLLAALRAHAQSGSWASEAMLLRRLPGEPYPVTCRSEMPPPWCGDPLGFQYAAQQAPALYAMNGIAVGTLLGAVAGHYGWDPFVNRRMVPFFRQRKAALKAAANQFDNFLAQVEARPPRNGEQATRLGLDIGIRLLVKTSRYLIGKTVGPFDNADGDQLSGQVRDEEAQGE